MFWVIATLKAVLDTTDFRRMGELREVAVPGAFKEAKVYLDNGPCYDVSLELETAVYLVVVGPLTGIAP